MALRKASLQGQGSEQTITDKRTGEVLASGDLDKDGMHIYVPFKPRFGRDFVVSFTSEIIRAAKSDLTGTDMRVFMFLLATVAFGNMIPFTQGEIAKELGITRPEVNKSMNKLKKMDFLTKSDNVYYFSVYAAWKGTVDGHNRLMKSLTNVS